MGCSCLSQLCMAGAAGDTSQDSLMPRADQRGVLGRVKGKGSLQPPSAFEGGRVPHPAAGCAGCHSPRLHHDRGLMGQCRHRPAFKPRSDPGSGIIFQFHPQLPWESPCNGDVASTDDSVTATSLGGTSGPAPGQGRRFAVPLEQPQECSWFRGSSLGPAHSQLLHPIFTFVMLHSWTSGAG